jgi:hypothetical protein
MHVPQSSFAIKVYVFNNHPTRPNMMLGKGRMVKFYRQDKAFCGSVWGCEKPIHIKLQPVEELQSGYALELGFRTTVEVPVRGDEVPHWIVIYNPGGYAAVMVPFVGSYQPPRRMWLTVRDYTPTEINEARESCLNNSHLAFIDFMPHQAPPPHKDESFDLAA